MSAFDRLIFGGTLAASMVKSRSSRQISGSLMMSNNLSFLSLFKSLLSSVSSGSSASSRPSRSGRSDEKQRHGIKTKITHEDINLKDHLIDFIQFLKLLRLSSKNIFPQHSLASLYVFDLKVS